MFDFGNVKEVRLSKGAHKTPEEGMCFMEMAAWFAGEAHSDKPACVSPSLGRLGIALNDSMDEKTRDRVLKPLIPQVVGTYDDSTEQHRAEYICVRAFNYAVGVLSPGFVRRYGAARAYGQARQMARDVCDRRHQEIMLRHGDKFDHYSMRMASGLEQLRRTVLAMLEYQTKFNIWEVSHKAVLNDTADTLPNVENVGAAGGVFSLMGEIIPDWSAGIDTLREAIQLGRHDGFDVSINLAAQHKKLRELVMAE